MEDAVNKGLELLRSSGNIVRVGMDLRTRGWDERELSRVVSELNFGDEILVSGGEL